MYDMGIYVSQDDFRRAMGRAPDSMKEFQRFGDKCAYLIDKYLDTEGLYIEAGKGMQSKHPKLSYMVEREITETMFEDTFGRQPSLKEFEEFGQLCEKGVDAQLDWAEILETAKETMEEQE